jgi:hypothetical protein
MRFSKELKGFVRGFTAGQKIMDNFTDAAYKKKKAALLDVQTQNAQEQGARANDPTAIQLGHDAKRAQIGSLGASAAANRSRANYYNAAQAAMAAPPAPPAGIDVSGVGGQPGAVEAIPGMAGGGMVPRYAGGGAVDEALDTTARIQRKRFGIPDKPDDRDKPKKETKSYEEGGLVEDDDVGMDAGEDDDDGPFSMEAGLDAAREGLMPQQAPQPQQPQAQPQQALDTDFSSQTRQPPRPVAGGDLRSRRAQAAPPVQVAEVEKMVDPQGKMTPSYRKVAALSAVYQHYIGQNNPQAARQAATSLMQHYAVVHGRYAAIARAAAEGGDSDAAAKAMVRAYEAIPSGIDFKVVKKGEGANAGYAYEFVDEKTGKTMRKGIMSGKEMLGAAFRMSNDSAESMVADAAGIRREKPKAPKAIDDKPPSMRDRETAGTAISAELERATPEGVPAYGDIAPDNMDAIKTIATNIRARNEVSEKDALIIARSMAEAGKNPNYKLVKGDESGALLQIDDGRQIKVSRNDLMHIASLRGRNEKGAEAKRTTDIEAASKSAQVRGEEDIQRNRVFDKRAEKGRRLPGGRDSRRAIAEQAAARGPEPAQALALNEEE